MAETISQKRVLEANSAANGQDDLPVTLHLELLVQNPETIAELCAHEEGETRERFALEALRIGVLALKSARGQIDADMVRRESDRLLHSLEHRLKQHSELIHNRLTSSLSEYFDPNSGRFQERIERLIRKDGELEQVLRRQIGEEDSELCKALSAHIGEESPLLKQLTPDESTGVLAALRKTLEEQLQLQREQVLEQFSLDNKEGALSRFIGELTDQNGQITEELQEKIDRLMKEFSLNEDESALNRLVRNVKDAQQTITKEFSLDEENSALARFKRELLELHEQHSEANRKFQEDVKATLEAMKARKMEADRSTRHGLEFEDAVYEFVQRESQNAGDVATHTGNSTGQIRNSKVGDAMVELGPDSAAPEARFVVEAKEKGSYSQADARKEIETARKNREAQVGLFVFSKKTAPNGCEPLIRFGNDVFVIWDAEEATTDVFLSAGISLARALCVRHQKSSDETSAEFGEIDKAILEIEKRANGLDDIETWAKTIQNNSSKILKKINIARKAFAKQIATLRHHTKAVQRAMTDGADEG